MLCAQQPLLVDRMGEAEGSPSRGLVEPDNDREYGVGPATTSSPFLGVGRAEEDSIVLPRGIDFSDNAVRQLKDVREKLGKTLWFGACMWSMVYLTLIMPVVMLFMGLVMSVPEPEQTVNVPSPLSWFPVFAVAAGFHLYIEFTCLRYSVIPFVQAVRRFSTAGLPLGFLSWLCFNFTNSGIYMMGIATHSLFTASWIVAADAGFTEEVDMLWNAALKQSYIFWMFPSIRVRTMVVLVWMLPEIRLIFHTVQHWPQRCTCERQFPVEVLVEGHEEFGREGTMHYRTIFGQRVAPGPLFFTLGELAGMQTVASQAISFRVHRVECTILEINKNNSRANAEAAWLRLHLLLMLRIMIWRIIFQGMLKFLVSLNLQISLLAMKRAQTGITPMGDVFSIVMSFLAIVPIIVSIAQFEICWREARPACEARPSVWSDAITDSDYFDFDYVKRRFWLWRMLLAVFVAILLYTVAKFVMLFRCPHALWDFPDRCVDLSS